MTRKRKPELLAEPVKLCMGASVFQTDYEWAEKLT
jgi:hypothetical protein